MTTKPHRAPKIDAWHRNELGASRPNRRKTRWLSQRSARRTQDERERIEANRWPERLANLADRTGQMNGWHSRA
ncbi:hypothetical protein [Mangrovactinospora gilvigrisea]|uniref:hypothetical protein n=1 Tax=Mangrovactinospora gilvigrisea TaxID=1428644 RepID=UPI001114CBF3|nr:hypothetical protein [Mangrovactinospora gilvigrisea]